MLIAAAELRVQGREVLERPGGATSIMAETPLEMARRHVVEGERILAEQEARVERLRRNGIDISEAEDALETYRKTLAQMRTHLAQLESLNQRDG